MQNDADKLIEIFSRIFPKSSGIPLHEPSFTGNEEKYVNDCIKSGW